MSTDQALFGGGGDTSVVYSCHSLVVSTDIASGKQKFFTGHTSKVYHHVLVHSSRLISISFTNCYEYIHDLHIAGMVE